MESNAASDAVRLPLDFAEDLSDDVLSRVVLHCCAPDALRFATCSRSSLAAADVMAHRLFVQTFGTFDLPATLTTGTAVRGKIFMRLDRARPNGCPEHFRETFSWAAGHGYCTFLQAAAQSWDDQLVHLLNGRKGSLEGIPPPLWRAAKRHQATAVTLLLELRADPECGKGGTTALFWAARHGDVPSVRELLNAGASPLHGNVLNVEPSRSFPRYPGGECALSAALQAPAEKASGGRLEAMQVMVESLTPEQRGQSLARRALLSACEAGLLPYVSVLLGPLGAFFPRHDTDDNEETPLLVALNRGFSEVAELLLQDKSAAGIHTSLPSGKSALHLAAEKGDARLLSLLLQARAQLDAMTSTGRTALHLAVEHDYEQAVQAICKHDGTKVRHLLQETLNGASAVCLAERRGKPAMILPMLRCYHKHLRERYLAGKLQDAGDRISNTGLTALCLKYRDTLFVNEDTSNAKLVTQAGKVAAMTLAPDNSAPDDGEKLRRYQRVLDKTRWSGVDNSLVGCGRLRSQMDLNQASHIPRVRSDSIKTEAKHRKPWGSASKPRQKSASRTSHTPFHGTSCPPSSQLVLLKPRLQGKQREAAAIAAEDEMQDLMLDFFSDAEIAQPQVCSGPEDPEAVNMYSSDED